MDKAFLDTDIFSEVLKNVDPLIAGIALHHDLVLVTGNQSHYLRIQGLGYGLKLDNWRV